MNVIGGISSNSRLYFAAVFGVLVQLAVLVFAGYSAYSPSWDSKKGGITTQKQAFPLMASGSLLLVAGKSASKLHTSYRISNV